MDNIEGRHSAPDDTLLRGQVVRDDAGVVSDLDRKSTRLNSSHTDISRMPSSA